MPRRCTICSHPEIKKLNQMICNNVSYRIIALQFNRSHASVQRHIEKCLTLDVTVVKDGSRISQSIDVYKEFQEQLEFAKELREAAREYLANPIDPLRLIVVPRSDEIDVVYYDHTDMISGDPPIPKKKTAKLSVLLANVEAVRNVEVDKVNIRHIDLRKFALDAVNTTDTCIDKFAKLGGLYQQPAVNTTDIERTVKAYQSIIANGKVTSDEGREAWLGVIAEGANMTKDELRRHVGVVEIGGVQ